MNYTTEQLRKLLTNLHLQIEVAKLNGETPKQAAIVSGQERENSVEEAKKLAAELSNAEKIKIKPFLVAELNSFKQQIDVMIVAVNGDIYGICTSLNMDVDYAKEFLKVSKDAVSDVEKTIDELLSVSEDEQEVKPKKRPVLLS